MKKFGLALAALFCTSFSSFAQNAGDDNGFGIKLNVGYTSGSSTVDDHRIFDMKYPVDGVSLGLTLDNRWYVWHNDKMGAAVNARWFEFNYMFGEYEYGDFDEVCADANTLEGGILGVGPMFTYYLGNNKAVDAYYNVLPSVFYSTFNEEPYQMSGSKYEMWGIGVTHHVGAAFRYKLLQAGLEYRFGKLNLDFVNDSGTCLKYPANNFRLFVGCKF